MAKKSNHYVDNEAFLASLVDYKQQVESAATNNLPHPKVPEYVGQCIIDIANHLSYYWKFSKHQRYKQEMIGDGIENALAAVGNFNTDKYKNPHAYFTQVMFWAFVRRIEVEKEHTYIKFKSLSSLPNYGSQSHDEGSYDNTYVKFLQENGDDIINNFEEKKRKKREKLKEAKKKIPKGLEVFYASDDDASSVLQGTGESTNEVDSLDN